MRSSPATSDLQGRIIGGCRILGRLSSGSMGDVYLAEQLSLGNRLVAVKVVPARNAATETTVQAAEARFMREAQVLASFAHPNILSVHDSGVTDDLFYLVMQYVPDGSLADVIRGKGHLHLALPAAPEQVAGLIRQIASALQYTHDRGTVHRDVKPGNTLVQVHPDGSWHVLLADFGIARNMESTADLHRVTGTIAYMAPEQFSGKFSPACDQYSLAVLTFYLLSGRTPFQGSAVEVMTAHQLAEPPDLHALSPAVSPVLAAVIARALAKNPSERWPTVTAFSEALSREAAAPADAAATRTAGALAPLVVASADAAAVDPAAVDAPGTTVLDSRTRPHAAADAPMQALRDDAPWYASAPAQRRRLGPLLLTLLAALLLAGLTVFLVQAATTGHAPSTPPQPTATTSPILPATPAGSAGGALAPGATPTKAPTRAPTAAPTTPPTATPTTEPSPTPTTAPSPTPTTAPTATPTAAPIATPTAAPAPTTGAGDALPAGSSAPADAARLNVSPSRSVVRQ